MSTLIINAANLIAQIALIVILIRYNRKKEMRGR